MLLPQELFQNMGLLDRNTQNYWIGNRTLRASLCCSCDSSLLDQIWFSSAERVQTALTLGHKLIISKRKVPSALGVNVRHSRPGTIEAWGSLSFCLMTGVQSSFYTKDRSFISATVMKCRQVEKREHSCRNISVYRKTVWNNDALKLMSFFTFFPFLIQPWIQAVQLSDTGWS